MTVDGEKEPPYLRVLIVQPSKGTSCINLETSSDGSFRQAVELFTKDLAVCPGDYAIVTEILDGVSVRTEVLPLWATPAKTGAMPSAPALKRFARTAFADKGKCSYCDGPSSMWMRSTIPAGDGQVMVAVRYCDAHSPDLHPGAVPLMTEITLADVLKLSPRRAARAAARAQKEPERAADALTGHRRSIALGYAALAEAHKSATRRRR